MNPDDLAKRFSAPEIRPDEGDHRARLTNITSSVAATGTITIKESWAVSDTGEHFTVRNIIKTADNLEIAERKYRMLGCQGDTLKAWGEHVTKAQPLCHIQIQHNGPFTNTTILSVLHEPKPEPEPEPKPAPRKRRAAAKDKKKAA